MTDRSKYYTTEDWEEIRNGLKERCDLLVKEKYELITEFLSRLDWIMERVVFHTENPDSELLDELHEEYNKWEGKQK